MNLYIDSNWTFKEVFYNIRALKTQYEDILCSFSYFQIKEVAKFKRNTRDKFYSLNLDEWQIDKLWEYINGFCPYEDLINILLKARNRQKHK